MTPGGGEGMTTARKIPLSQVVIDDEVKSRVLAATESGQYILGPECKAFEMELASYFGRGHCVLLNSATSGLLLTLKALGVGPGDEVLAPAHTAFPTIEAIFLLGRRRSSWTSMRARPWIRVGSSRASPPARR